MPGSESGCPGGRDVKGGNFEMRRLLDGLVYAFEWRTGLGKAAVYERNDGVVRVIHDPRFGWSIWSDEGDIVGRVWETLPQDQGEYPTEGIWVSRKGEKSYVYELVYATT